MVPRLSYGSVLTWPTIRASGLWKQTLYLMAPTRICFTVSARICTATVSSWASVTSIPEERPTTRPVQRGGRIRGSA
jgi:hypothetical protein